MQVQKKEEENTIILHKSHKAMGLIRTEHIQI